MAAGVNLCRIMKQSREFSARTRHEFPAAQMSFEQTNFTPPSEAVTWAVISIHPVVGTRQVYLELIVEALSIVLSCPDIMSGLSAPGNKKRIQRRKQAAT
jgi:hypothetical protein